MPTDGTAARLAISSCPSPEVAAPIARALVDERLAACVTILPGARSTYRWQGVVEEADEVVLLIKTSADRVEALTARLSALHPYEVPELIVLDVAGGVSGYLAWLDAETRA